MNLYLRYFDNETLVTSVDAAIDFLRDIDEINLDASLEADLREYAASSVLYPKRYKIRARVYFIVIKTLAATMQEFKQHRKHKDEVEAKDNAAPDGKERPMTAAMMKLNEVRLGWYEGRMEFKRVNLEPRTGKFRYLNTPFVANVKATSGLDCYNRMVSHLQERVDPRSQFPSPKGKNFNFRFLGAAK